MITSIIKCKNSRTSTHKEFPNKFFGSVIISLLALVWFVVLHTGTVPPGVSVVYAEEPVAVNENSGEEYNIGLGLFNEGKYSQSIVHFKKAYSLDEKNISALFASGLAYSRIEKYKEASAQLNLVLEKDPAHGKALKLYPSILANAGDLEGALTAYDRGISIYPDDYSFYYGKARVYLKLKKPSEALPLLDKALEKNPKQQDLIQIQTFRAQTLAEMGHMDDAYKSASAILEKNPNHARARVIVADYERLIGKLKEALEDYKLAAKSIETKAYAEHYIGIIRQQLEEMEIEKEFEERQKNN